MNEVIDRNVLNVYADKVHISFEPKTNERKNSKKKEKKKDDNKIGKSKVIAILLALFFGRYGLHKFYLGKPALGIVYLIFSRYHFIIFFSICDAFIYLFMNNETWLKEYGYHTRPAKKKKPS